MSRPLLRYGSRDPQIVESCNCRQLFTGRDHERSSRGRAAGQSTRSGRSCQRHDGRCPVGFRPERLGKQSGADYPPEGEDVDEKDNAKQRARHAVRGRYLSSTSSWSSAHLDRGLPHRFTQQLIKDQHHSSNPRMTRCGMIPRHDRDFLSSLCPIFFSQARCSNSMPVISFVCLRHFWVHRYICFYDSARKHWQAEA